MSRVGPADLLDVELDERLNVFTCDNGLGKSFILDVAWWVLARTWAGRPAFGCVADGVTVQATGHPV